MLGEVEVYEGFAPVAYLYVVNVLLILGVLVEEGLLVVDDEIARLVVAVVEANGGITLVEVGGGMLAVALVPSFEDGND